MTAPKEACVAARVPVAEIRQRIAERDSDGDIMAIIADAADAHNLTVDELLGYCREKPNVMARDAVWAAMYELGHWSLPRLGWLFGRDHTTVLGGIRRHLKRVREQAA